MSLTLACILLAIDLARTVDGLAGWWNTHQPALRVLAPEERAAAITAKDARKAVLLAPPPPPRGSAPPEAVAPWTPAEANRHAGRLL
ncbi:hypothetical protein [Sandarakinorhabdus sp.]|uniref:hypothetical protein n=1 Tax=Sandarakinorhabdus sp. TaxID=1916663 RepID=UPI003567415A